MVGNRAVVERDFGPVPRANGGREAVKELIMAGGKTFKRDQKRRKEMARKLKQEEKLKKKIERREAKKTDGEGETEDEGDTEDLDEPGPTENL